MSGLECSEIYFNNIHDNLFRLEAEYYKKIYLGIEKKLANYNELGMYVNSINCGPFGSSLLDDKYEINGVLVVRPFNLKQLTIENENLVYISEETLHDNNLKKYGRNTVLFSRVGDIKIGVSNRDNITISPNIIAVSLKNELLAKYVAVFFYTKYGFLQIKRQLKISAQPTISTNVIEKLKIPFFDKLVDRIISKLDITENLMQQANKAYLKAEQLLVKELNIKIKNDNNINIKSFNNSFGNSGRLDAEYYLPKYDDLFNELYELEKNNIKIKKVVKLRDIVDIKKSIEPGSDEYTENGISFIRVSDISKYTINSTNIYLDREKFDIDNLKPKKNTILLSKDGTIGIAYKVVKDMDCITSSALLHLKIKDSDILPDYLTLVLNSFIVKMQSERDAGGSILQHWRISEIENVVIPILNINIQKQIEELLQKYNVLYNQSKLLLEVAKKSVEIAIEQNEDSALKYLEEKSNEVLN